MTQTHVSQEVRPFFVLTILSLFFPLGIHTHTHTHTLVPTTHTDRLEQLKEFKAQFGHCNVNIRYKANPTLGKWCNNMREQYKNYCRKTKLEQEGKDAEAKQLPKCPMNADRVRLLEEVGFQWSTNRSGGFDEAWDRRLEELKQYKQANGNCDVPHGYKENPVLAEWVHRQRCTYVAMKDREKTGETRAEQKLRVHLEFQQKKKGKDVTPSPHVAAAVAASKKDPKKDDVMEEVIRKRMAILEKMGFLFKVKDNIWLQRLQELKDYKAEHGDCGVPITYPPNPSLGRWVHTQRHQEKLRRENRNDGKKSSQSTMTDERFALLDAIGFNWEIRTGPKISASMKPPHLYSWEDRFEELRVFYQTTGHCMVPADHNPYLNEWCSEQKELLMALQVDPNDSMARARMTDEQVQRLASVGFTSTTDLAPPLAEYAPMGHEAAVAAAVATAEGDHVPEMGQTDSQQV